MAHILTKSSSQYIDKDIMAYLLTKILWLIYWQNNPWQKMPPHMTKTGCGNDKICGDDKVNFDIDFLTKSGDIFCEKRFGIWLAFACVRLQKFIGAKRIAWLGAAGQKLSRFDTKICWERRAFWIKILFFQATDFSLTLTLKISGKYFQWAPHGSAPPRALSRRVVPRECDANWKDLGAVFIKGTSLFHK